MTAPGWPQRRAHWRRRTRDPWADPAPIRSEIFGAERFERHAQSLADSQTVVRTAVPVVSLLERLEEDETALAAAYDAILDDVHNKRGITPAAEWIIDNFHVVETQVRQIRQDLPRDYFRQLPKLGPGFLSGHPRVFGIVWAYVAHTDSLVDPDLLARYVRAYETRKPLTLGELWAVAITLRLLLIENLRRLADLVVASSRDRQHADEVADRLFAPGAQRASIQAVIPQSERYVPSRAFSVRLLRRLRGQDRPDVDAWLADRLAAADLDPEVIVLEEHQHQASATVTMRNIFTSLRLITDLNWPDWVESVSLIEEQLRANPGYAGLDFPTRNLYRSAVEDLARGSHQQELDVARAALIRAEYSTAEVERDVGYWLLDDGQAEFATSIGYRAPWRRRVARFARGLGVGGYLAALTAVVLVLLGPAMWGIDVLAGGLSVAVLVVLGLLASVPVSDLALGIVNVLSARWFVASTLPGLALRDGVPEQSRTMVAIPTLLSSLEDVDEVLAQLEVHFLANSGGEIYFALVTDWTDHTEPTRDDDLALVERARTGIRELNERHGERFILAHRPRTYNASEDAWMGWERKRGKLDELGRLLRGARDTGLTVHEGRLPGPFRYVLTLDADTKLPREAARRLVGKISHPLNRSRVDPVSRRPVRGYGILQPRVTPSLPMSEGSSLVQRVYSTQRGLDPYTFAVSDVYQDLFGEGSFAGKGIYDIEAVDAALAGRIPENTLLSHDLLEGNYARSGLVTDVEVVEEYPLAYEVAAARAHRWARGDWQLLPWLLHRRQGIGGLGLWKMVDNLRRSLSPMALVLGVAVGLALLPRAAALGYTGVLLATVFLPPLLPLAPRLLLRRKGVTKASQIRGLGEDLRDGVLLGWLNLTFLAHQAWMTLDAIARTLYRLVVSRKHLLQWRTAAAVQAGAGQSLSHYVRLMRGGFVAPVLVGGVAALRGVEYLAVAAVPCLLWLAAPAIAQRASRATDAHEAETPAADRELLRRIARRTWLFFDTFVTAGENHLPPDNFQEDPEPVVAHRTSPTNIGLYLLTTVAARDLGWIGLAEASERIHGTLTTMGRLERYRGHLYNWIDTLTLTPLEPRYVSTVDSGNLAGHLLVLSVACREWLAALDEDPGVTRLDGIRDGIGVLREALHDGEPTLGRDDVARVAKRTDALAEALAATGPPGWASLAEAVVAEADQLDSRPGAEEIRVWARSVARSVDSVARDVVLATRERGALRQRLQWCAAEAMRWFLEMDFGFLYDARRSLLSVGLHVPSGRLDDSCYDLLASEARLASYLAIAKGDVRTRHWFLLGRAVTAVGGGAALQSWSGSMFEYLMPPLVMHAPLDGLLDRTAQLVVRRQMGYAEELGVPWGISEAAFNARDLDLTYQYSPFGVPGLGVVRGLADNVVIAPYATGLAAMVDPVAATVNFLRLRDLGARGRYGYYEALDFTPSRVPKDEGFALVRCYMAHHQGMSIVSVYNAVTRGRMRERFHSVPMIRATELLLQERAPRDVPVTHARRERSDPTRSLLGLAAPQERTFTGAAAWGPAIHFLSNGRLSLTLTPAGGGQLRWQGNALTRWHPDPTSEQAGDHIYLRDEATGQRWSATPLPVLGRSPCEARLADDRAVYRRQHGPYATELEYHLSPESDALVRRLTIRNQRPRAGRVTLTSYAELVLAPARDDDAHPAFSKLFVHTEYLPDQGAIIAHRRARSPGDPAVWAGHMLFVESPGIGMPAAESDRLRFLGRGNSVRDPAQLAPGSVPSGTMGDVLDPVFSLTQRLRVPAEGEVQVYFWTFAASSRDEILHLIDQHASVAAYERVAMLAWTQSQVQLRHLGITAQDAGTFQTLAGHVVHPHPALRPAQDVLVRDAAPQSALWPLGISGDLPIVVVRIDDPDDIALARQLVQAFEYWRLRRFAVDLVLLNEESSTYVQALHRTLEAIAAGIRERTWSPDSTGRIYVVQADQAGASTVSALLTSASAVLRANLGDLAGQLPSLPVVPIPPPATSAPAGVTVPPSEGRAQTLVFDNGFGGFAEDGREYVTVLDAGRPTPMPWSNVVANEQFGFLTTAEGAGHTWWRNSRDNQLTPWRNDPVTALASEAIYVRDDASGVVATPTASPMAAGRHTAWHGFGYSAFLHETDDLRLDLVQFVPRADPVKVSWLKISNLSAQRRVVTVTSYHDLVLGTNRQLTARRLVTSRDEHTGALLVRNPWSTQFGEQVVFVDLAGEQTSLTADRHELLGTQGTLAAPRAVLDGGPLSGRTGAGLDPCAALQTTVTLEPGQTRDVRVLLGAAQDVQAVRELVTRHRDTHPLDVLDEVKRDWDARLGTVAVTTPDPAFDLVMNGWLLYQTLACRMLARCGFHQTSGAYGFRDQLQDGMALVLVDPQLARAHLLRAAGRQFTEGDVQHWWLPGDGSGVRTRISDDVVWLSHAVARYVKVTGDTGVLDEVVPYLEGATLGPQEHESFFLPRVSAQSDTLYAHCVKGIERAFRYGVHGLPLMGTGDWNDGMNRVGVHGAGESVWLGWFLHRTLTDFMPLARTRGDRAFVTRCQHEQARLHQALEDHGWDGAWYRRGYFDDGTPLGSAGRPECRIDSIAQSWAVLSGATVGERGAQAMDEADSQLVMRREGVARLFTPPFDQSLPDPGYIKAYPPGVRENGGQYTHAATWSILAHAALGREDKAWALFSLVNPVNHTRTPTRVDTYKGEPYVMAADVYSVAPHVGRAGWTWYTGSSGWMYRAGLEAILGLRREGESLLVDPCLPPDWTSAAVRYRHGDAVYHLVYDACPGWPRAVVRIEVDGVPLPQTTRIPLSRESGEHQVRVVLDRVDGPV
ncbi:MAG: GH36-type glycosyl hydrolase domain-containing protein [Dermatophilaceae bacterium]